MILDEKPLDSITSADLDALVQESICESPRIEYKRQWWGDNDEGKREMLRDIASFANATGGYIVIGVHTERGQGAGSLECPTAIPGIEPTNYQERILRSCRDNLDPICVGIEALQVTVTNGNICVVVKIPQSLSAPHMVTFKGLNQFWQRHGTDKQRMTTGEIRNLMFTRFTYEEKLLQTSQNRKETLRRKAGASPVFFIWASPVVPLPEEISINEPRLRQALGESLQTDPFRQNCELYCGLTRPSLYGIEAADDQQQWLGLLRHGFLEFGTTGSTYDEDGVKAIVGVRVAIYLENFANLLNRLCITLGIQGPIAFGCCLLNVTGHRLHLGENRPKLSERTWNDPDLDLGLKVAYDFNGEKNVVLKQFNDLLWNAFHYNDCPHYREGRLQLPNR